MGLGRKDIFPEVLGAPNAAGSSWWQLRNAKVGVAHAYAISKISRIYLLSFISTVVANGQVSSFPAWIATVATLSN